MQLGRSAERRAEAKAEQNRRRAESDRQIEQKRREEEEAAFRASPTGRARTAFERGDQVFQYGLNVMNQQAIIIAMVGARAPQRATDPTAILNAVCREGWELVNGSFVFVQTGQESRDKFMASGQNVAIAGAVVGYYLFKRNWENRVVEGVDDER